jgi:3-oxoacyl-(acyl-carrier-protein) synthase
VQSTSQQDSIRGGLQVALHGTGTPLGDPIEVGALGQALQGRGAARRSVVTLAAVKSCYGHTEGAAGLTGAGSSTSSARRTLC